MANFDIRRPGMGIALVTPFDITGAVDYDALGRLVDFQIEDGADFIVLLATTGETVTLTKEEQARVSEFVVDRVAGRVPLVRGLGCNCTASLVEEAKSLDLSPFDAILSVCPFYNKPSQEGLYRHFMALADASSKPVILYNVPGRTGVNMTPETVLRLAHDHANIIGIKEASGNLVQQLELLNNKPSDFMVLSGDDALTLPMVNNGAVGVISVIGNAFPGLFARMVHLALDGDNKGAWEIHHRLWAMFHLLFVDGNPSGIKALLHAMGRMENVLRLPLTPVSERTYSHIADEYRHLTEAEQS